MGLFGHKKDKITKEIGKIKKVINIQKNNDEISLLEGHKILVNEITDVYKNGNYSYNDLLKRKNIITNFNNNYKEIVISFAFGILTSLFVAYIQKICNYLSSLISGICPDINNSLLQVIIMIAVTVILILAVVLWVVFFIIRSARELSYNDPYHTDEYELKIIEKKLEKLEK